MEIDERKIEDIVRQVLATIRQTSETLVTQELRAPAALGELGIFSTIEDAIDAAHAAQKILASQGIEVRKKYIEAMREAGIREAKRLARMAVDETKMGKYEDKILKNEVNARLTPGPESVTPEVITGDKGLLLIEYVPFGVIAAVTPITNPTSTIINNSIMMLSAGNSVVFLPHPGAKECTLEAIRVMNRALKEAGAPDNLIVSCSEVSLRNVEKAFKHPKVSMVCATGGSAVVKAALTSGKKAIGAGPGNPVALVDETADIPKAARDIVTGATFDNNLPCICEKVVVAVDQIVDQLTKEMVRCGAYLLKGDEVTRVTNLVVDGGEIKREYIGKDAAVILRDAGIRADGAVLVIFEADPGHPIVQHEQMMPVLPIVRARDYEHAKQLALEFEHGYGHTSIIHSKDVARISDFARTMGTTIFVVNAPSLHGDGTGEGPVSMTLAGPTGEGLTVPKTFTRQRRIMVAGALSVRGAQP